MPTTAYQNVVDLILQKLPTGSPGGIIAEDHRDVENALLAFAESQWLKGDIKEVDCTDAYIAANFTNTGLGTGEREGWAICNGQNGTRNRIGRVSVAWGGATPPAGSGATSHPSIGGTGLADLNPAIYGGAVTHTLTVTEMPAHSHLMKQGNAGPTATPLNTPIYASGDDYTQNTFSNDATRLPSTNITGGAGSTSTNNSSGGSAVSHNNMQPYIVTLFIQKL
jgi:microcystin-dependent protein